MVSSGSRRAGLKVLSGALALACTTAFLSACDAEAPTGSGGPRPSAEETSELQSGATEGPTEEPRTPAERLGLATGWGPTEAELDRAVRLTGELSLPELAGQVIVADYAGLAAPVSMVRRLHLAGTIAFSANVASARQVRAANLRLRREVRRPLVVSVDQEGGVVERVRTGVTRFPAFMSAGAAGDPAMTEKAYAAAATELAWAGFTMDFAPVADVTSGPADPTIGSRSAGSDPATVSEQMVAAARGYASAGVLPVVKHFPGHGSVPADSHQTLPVQTRSLRELREIDLVPFAAAVAEGLPAVMVGHLDVRAVDPRVPSSLSKPVVAGLLRDELGFEGLVVTDSLEMAALRSSKGAAPVVRALRAGVDLLLMPPDPAVARAAIVRSVRSGTLSRQRLRQAAARTLALLLHQRAGAPRPRPASAARASYRLSAAALTSVAGPCHGDLVGRVVSLRGDSTAMAVFAGRARAAGLEVLVPRLPPARLANAEPAPERRDHESRRHFRQRKKEWRDGERVRERRLARWQAREATRLARGTTVAFAGYRDGPVAGDVAVATDTPFVLGSSRARVKVATYGASPGAMSSLVDLLVGRGVAPGELPVRVAGLERRGC
ncbi:glycoside hydrolase family 3 protein [Nocardioides bigeumensis]|uniref:beta-N-acetylhexosaminidase n=1 Tax=Nocardioides bigeumensis TaxID=433657 RepID=A0ABN2YQ64_9ACTN